MQFVPAEPYQNSADTHYSPNNAPYDYSSDTWGTDWIKGLLAKHQGSNGAYQTDPLSSGIPTQSQQTYGQHHPFLPNAVVNPIQISNAVNFYATGFSVPANTTGTSHACYFNPPTPASSPQQQQVIQVQQPQHPPQHWRLAANSLVPGQEHTAAFAAQTPQSQSSIHEGPAENVAGPLTSFVVSKVSELEGSTSYLGAFEDRLKCVTATNQLPARLNPYALLKPPRCATSASSFNSGRPGRVQSARPSKIGNRMKAFDGQRRLTLPDFESNGHPSTTFSPEIPLPPTPLRTPETPLTGSITPYSQNQQVLAGGQSPMVPSYNMTQASTAGQHPHPCAEDSQPQSVTTHWFPGYPNPRTYPYGGSLSSNEQSEISRPPSVDDLLAETEGAFFAQPSLVEAVDRFWFQSID